MPLVSTCADHPGWVGENTTDDLAHLVAAHAPDTSLNRGGPITTRLVRQNVAQGNPDRYRYACRRCGTMTDTTTPVDPTTAHCEDCTP